MPLDKPRPLNDVERAEAFQNGIKVWDIEKQSAFLKLEIAVKDRRNSIRYRGGASATPKNGKVSFGFSYSRKATIAVKNAEASLLALLNRKERKFYKLFMLPVLFPERIPYEDRELPKI
ncbi:MAG: hypothetical protein ABFD66_07520 [Smithella sp.]